MIPLQTKLQTIQNRLQEDPPRPEPRHEEKQPPEPPSAEAWEKTLQELRIGLYAAFGHPFKHLDDPLVLSYWHRQFQDRHLTPEDILATLQQITHRETKAPTLADFLSIAIHARESRCWRAQHQEKRP